MTVIRPNSVSGITSITAQANEINVFRSNGLLAGLNLNGVNFNTTAGISTLAALKVTGNVDVAGVLTYQDVTNVDSLGIGTFRVGVNVPAGQLDVGSNIKLGNAGVVTATSFVGSGANLTGITQTTINTNADNRVITGSGSANTLNGEQYFTWNGNNLALRGGESQNCTIELASDEGDDPADFWRVMAQASDNALAIDHYGSGSWVEQLRISSNGNLLLGTTTDTQRLHVYNGNGGTGYKTALFDSNDTSNGTRVVITNSGNTSNRGLGIIVGGQAGTDRASFGWFNNNNTYVTPNLMTIQSDGKIGIGRNDPVNFVDIVRGQDEENILLVRGADSTTEYGALGVSSGYYYITAGGAGSTSAGIIFRTAASGNETNRLLITSAGNVEPATDDTYNFGSLTKRWANIYTADLNLSNEGKTNDVDGTWGQYTIQEGEDNLYLINKRSGKKYKFLLQEVS